MTKKIKSASAALASHLRSLPRRAAAMVRLVAYVGSRRAGARLGSWRRRLKVLWEAAGCAVGMPPAAA